MNEAELLSRCRSGDRDAFRLLVEEHGDLVRRTAYLMVGDRLLAEDLSQEAFLLAWRGIGTFRTETGFKPWLMRILTNCIASHRRRRSPRVLPLETVETLEEPSDPEPGPHEQAERAERGREMADALATLPEEWSRVLVLRYYVELSVPEIALALDWPEGTVKSRLHRSLEALRKVLGRADEQGSAVRRQPPQGSLVL